MFAYSIFWSVQVFIWIYQPHSKMPLTLFEPILHLTSFKVLSFCKFFSHLFFFFLLFRYIQLVIMFVSLLFIPMNIAPVKAESTGGEKYSAFLNSFHPDMKWLIWRLVNRSKIEYTNIKCLSYIYIYIYIFIYKGLRSTVREDDKAFWVMKRPITIDILEKGTTVNSASYC